MRQRYYVIGNKVDNTTTIEMIYLLFESNKYYK